MSVLLQTIRAFLNRSSHLSSYLPLARQDPDQKLSRLIADKSAYPYSAKIHPFPAKVHSHSLPEAKTLKSFEFKSTTSVQLCMNPMNGWLLLWYMVVFLGIIFFFSETTIILVYGDVAWQAALASPVLITLDIFFILIFIGDIYIQLNTGYITNSAIILDRFRVKDRYTHYYFYFDILLIAVLSISVIIRVQLFNYAKLIIFYKFIRMFEFNGIFLRRLATNVVARTTFEISKQFVTIFILSHIIGLIFYVIDFALTNDPICEGANQSFCWLYSATAYSPIIQLDWTLQYFYSLYWGVNTMCQISYGDIAPNNPVETPYAVFCMCFGSVVYTYIVNNIVKAIIWANEKRDQFRVDLVTFDKYMEQLRLKRQDQYQIVNFLKERFREAPNRNLMLEDLMKAKLPEDMKIELVRNAYSHILQGLEYFMGGGMPVNKILFSIREKRYGQNEQIITQGAPLDELCFMIKGQVVLSCQFHRLKYGICTLNMPDTFIAAYQFFLNQRSSYSVVSKSNTAFYFISRQILNQQAQQDLQFKQILHMLSYDLFIRNKIDRIFFSCFFCGKMHQWHQCDDVLPDFKAVTLLNSTVRRQEEGVRVVNTKHHTWKDYKKLRELDRIVMRGKDKVLSRLQKRIFALKKRLEVYDELFQVDVAYNWSLYLGNENINRFKEDWNKKLTNRRSSIIGGKSIR